MLRFCALVFTSGETLEIVLHKERNNVNILSICEKYFPFSWRKELAIWIKVHQRRRLKYFRKLDVEILC